MLPVAGIRFGRRYLDVSIPMLTTVLPVSAPSNNDWALGVGSQPASEFPTLLETARPVNLYFAPP